MMMIGCITTTSYQTPGMWTTNQDQEHVPQLGQSTHSFHRSETEYATAIATAAAATAAAAMPPTRIQ